MKIAITSLIGTKVQNHTYGGTEAFTYELVEGLLKQRHDVTLYASSDSNTHAPLVSVQNSIITQEEVLGEHLSYPYYLLLAQKLALESNKYDIIHDNFFKIYLLSGFAPFIKTPIVHTVHSAYFHDPRWVEIYKEFLKHGNQHLVFVSKQAREAAGNLPNSYFVYNGVNTSLYKFSPQSEDYFLWLGRLTPEKGAKEAIEVAKQAKIPLVLNALILNDAQMNYYKQYIVPVKESNIQISNTKGIDEKISLYQKAKAFLFPLSWEEPFGLVLVEAMATGTPIIAYARGAVPEIVKDGVTGFIVNYSTSDMRGDFIIKTPGIGGLIEAVERINTMSNSEYEQMRFACRKHVEEHFTLEKMIEGYEKVYASVIGK